MKTAAAVAVAADPSQRRAKIRYPLAMNMEYQFVGGGNARGGNGRSLNMSSCGVLFKTDVAVPAGVLIVLRIVWPATLNQDVELVLHISGRTVRSDGNLTAVVFGRHEFRTRAVSGTYTTAGAANPEI